MLKTTVIYTNVIHQPFVAFVPLALYKHLSILFFKVIDYLLIYD